MVDARQPLTYFVRLRTPSAGVGTCVFTNYDARRKGVSRLLDNTMDVNSFKTYSARPSDVERRWYIIDAENQIVGRLATQVATILRGKHKPQYTPHIDTGDHIIVINAEKVRFSGLKETQKNYFRHSGRPGGGKVRTPEVVREKKPTFIVENAVKGMLPKGPLGRSMLRKLKVYAGSEHPHAAQQPESIQL